MVDGCARCCAVNAERKTNSPTPNPSLREGGEGSVGFDAFAFGAAAFEFGVDEGLEFAVEDALDVA
jgi:hypothetical protein